MVKLLVWQPCSSVRRLARVALLSAGLALAVTMLAGTSSASAQGGGACVQVAEYFRTDDGGTFFQKQVKFRYDGGPVTLASDCDGDDMWVDDFLTVTNLSNGRVLEHDYSNGCSGTIFNTTHDITSLLRDGSNQLLFEGDDICSQGNSGVSDIYIVADLRCAFKKKKTGKGYKGLSKKMKAAVGRLYDELDEVDACYRFTSGYRSQKKQNRLRRRWHKIADKPKGDKRSPAKINRQLKKAGFKQKPKGYRRPNKKGLRVAKGGPAKRSRHTSRTAADLKVRFPHQENVAKFQAAARAAGLCGPPRSDSVHVELPYKKKGSFQCWFPRGPAPSAP